MRRAIDRLRRTLRRARHPTCLSRQDSRATSWLAVSLATRDCRHGSCGFGRRAGRRPALPPTRDDISAADLARVVADHQADHRFLESRAVRADAGRRRHLAQARQPGRLLAILRQHHLRGRGHVQARQCPFPQALGVVAVLDAGLRWARAAVQCPRLPELPSEGRARPSAGRRRPTRPRCSCGWRGSAETAEEKAAVADHKVLNFPDPVYGGQLQDLAVPGLPGEGKMAISYAEAAGDARRRHAWFRCASRPIR